MLGQKSVIGIEITSTQLKLIEAQARRGMIILDAQVIDIPSGDPEEIGWQLTELAKQGRFRGRAVNVAFSGIAADHRVLVLPKMSRKEIKLVAQREVRKAAPHLSENVVVDVAPAGTVEERGAEKQQILVVAAAGDELKSSLHLLDRAKVTPKRIETVPVALANAVQLHPGIGNETIGFLHVGKDGCSIVVVRQQALVFSREFPLRNGQEASAPGDRQGRIARIVTEANRSIMYYKQRFRGEDVVRIVFSADSEEGSELGRALTEAVGIVGEPYDPTPSLSVGPQIQDQIGMLGTMAVPLGLAWEGTGAVHINLLPREAVQKHLRSVQQLLAAGWGAGLAAFLAAGYIWLPPRVASYRQAFQEMNTVVRGNEPAVTERQTIEAETFLHRERLAAVQKLYLPKTALVDLFRELSHLVPPEMHFTAVEVKREPSSDGGMERQVWEVSIKGDVTAADAAQVQSPFNRFFAGLSRSPLITEVVLKPIEMRRVEEVEGRAGRREKRTQLSFEVELKIPVSRERPESPAVAVQR